MTTDVLHEVVETYRVRRRELMVAARNAMIAGDRDVAQKCRDGYDRLEEAIESEQENRQPEGIGKWERFD